MFFRKKKKESDEVPVPPSLSPEDTERMLSESFEKEHGDLPELPPMPEDLTILEEKSKPTKVKTSKKIDTKISKKKLNKKVEVKKSNSKIVKPSTKDDTDEMLEKSFSDPTIRNDENISLDQLDSDLKAIEKSIAMTESALNKIDADLAKINKKL